MSRKSRWLGGRQGVVLLGCIFLVAGCQEGDSGTTQSPASRFLGNGGRIIRAQKKVPGEYIVLLKDGTSLKQGVAASAVHASTDQLLARYAGKKKRVFSHAIRGFSARMSEQAAQALAADPTVAMVKENGMVEAFYVQPNATWGLDRIDQQDLPLSQTFDNRGLTGEGKTVYVIDSGIRTSHQEFEGRASVGADFVGDGLNGQDGCGHGTHVAGIIAGKTYGVAKKANVVSVRVLYPDGMYCQGTDEMVIAGVDWVTANHVPDSVVNMSLGSNIPDLIIDTAVRNSIQAGVTYVLAAGNSSTDQLGSPAGVSEALVIGATDTTDNMAWFSNFGAGIDLFAPGVGIMSSINFSEIAASTLSGTSMAAPHVAGLAALFLQVHPGSPPVVVHNTLISSSSVNKLSSLGAGSPNRLSYLAYNSAALQDDFEDGNALGWTVHDGAWSMVTEGTEVYQGTNNDGYARVSAGSGAWTDQTVEAKIKPVSFSGTDRFVVLAARFVDAQNYYYIALRSSGKIELKRLQNNTPTTLAWKSIGVSTGTWYTVKLEAVGTSLKAYVNNTLQVSATDSTFAAGKMAMGVYRGQAQFDDVLVSLGNLKVASDPYPPTPTVGVYPVGVTLTWIPGAGAVSHDVYFGTSATPPFVGNQPNNTYSPATLQNFTTYYWRVNEHDSSGTVTQGPVWSFTTGEQIGMPSNPSPADGATNTSRNPFVSWVPASGAIAYRFFLGTSVATLAEKGGGLPGAPPRFYLWDLLPSTTYYWQLESSNASHSTLGPIWSFTTDDGSIQTLPEPATNPMPSDLATQVSSSTTLSWTAGAGATSYEIYFGTSVEDYGDFGHVSYQTGTSYNPGPLLPNKTYYWQVIGRNTAGWQPGPIWQFTTGSVPEPATDPTPANNATGVDLQPTLFWVPGAGATSQDVYFGATVDESGDPPFIGNQGAGGYSSSYDPGTLLPNTTYYWRIDERNASGVRGGTLWQFTTTAGASPLFSDDFEDGNSSGWTTHSGSWSVITDGTKVFNAVNSSGYARASAGSSAWTNQTISARIKPVTPSGSNRFIILCGRFQDTNNYYYLALRSNNTLELKKLVGGVASTLGSAPLTLTLGTWFDVKLQIVGTSLVGEVNGVPLVSATDTQFASGKIAVGSYAFTAEFDNILVTQ